jgi:regulatory protein
MDDEGRTQGRGARPRARKPTFAERRERRAEIEDVAEVLDAAARFLEARPRSVHEVRYKLTTMGYRPALVDEVVVRLTDLRYLDDEAFTRAWVESRDRARPRGEHALRRELQLKGVDAALVGEVLDQRREEARANDEAGGVGAPVGPDAAAAERLLRKKLPAILREADLRRRRQRAYALLARSGFAPDVCASVSRAVLDDTATEESLPDADGP